MKYLKLALGLLTFQPFAASAQNSHSIECIKYLPEGQVTVQIHVEPSRNRLDFAFFKESEKTFQFFHHKKCFNGYSDVKISGKGEFLYINALTESNCRLNIVQKSQIKFVKSGHPTYPLKLHSLKFGQTFTETLDVKNIPMKGVPKIEGAYCKLKS